MVARTLHDGTAPCVADTEAFAHRAVQEDLFQAENLGKIWVENFSRSWDLISKLFCDLIMKYFEFGIELKSKCLLSNALHALMSFSIFAFACQFQSDLPHLPVAISFQPSRGWDSCKAPDGYACAKGTSFACTCNYFLVQNFECLDYN